MRMLVMILACVAATAGYAQRATDAPIAELRWLDRTTGDRSDIALRQGETRDFGPLKVTLHGCRYPERAINADAFAFLQIDEAATEQRLFSGWMVASSPALNALEHPRYDIWVLRCRQD